MTDKECIALTREQQSRQVANDRFESLELISNRDLYDRYLAKCAQLALPVRVLFVESDYNAEIWQGELPEMNELGYEYCPIPIDDQIITDMDWYKPFSKYHSQLNEHGLFNSFEVAAEFAKDYEKAMHAEEIGDGEITAFIFRVSQTCE